LITANAPVDLVAHLGDGTSIERRYLGAMAISQIASGLCVINTIDLEAYVPSVMASEISSGWHPEALRAQAIAVRTYAARRAVQKGAAARAYDLTDDTSNQVYKGIDSAKPSLADAARATAGMILSSGSSPADVWYHSACGGHTAATVEVTGAVGPQYLLGIADADSTGRAYCAASPYYSWRNRIDAAAMARVIDSAAGSISGLSVLEAWPDGRVKTLRATMPGGSTRDVDGHAFYARAGAVLGYKVVPSALFVIAGPTGGAFEISGHGVGHGVGMCQWGAQGRALAGLSAESILAAYFPGTILSTRSL
jgi:stage II sporulation protein D